MNRKTELPRPVGRPRTLPTGTIPRQVGFTDAEWAALDALARAAGVTPNVWVRRAAIRAAKLAPQPGTEV